MDPFLLRYFPGEGDALEGYHAELRHHVAGAANVLDLGCGSNTDLAPYRTAEREVWGVDFAPHPDLQHTAWFRRLGRGGEVPFPDNYFDLVACSWVLEHVARPRPFLGEVCRILRPGGRLVALTVNGLHYVSWISRALGWLPHAARQGLVRGLYGRPPHDTYPTYYRLNTWRQLRRAAEGGLELTELRRFANADYFSFWPRLRRAAVVNDWLLERLWPGLGRLYVVATLRKPGSISVAAEAVGRGAGSLSLAAGGRIGTLE
jgi:SAM-dependent methyltransferase